MQEKNTFAGLLLRLFILISLVLLSIVIVSMDSGLLIRGSSEDTVTEISQKLCILLAVILFALATRYDTRSRGFFILVTGLFAAMAIREADGLLDNIQKGFWLYPALSVSAVAIYFSIKQNATVKLPLLAHMNSIPFAYITQGLVIILIFSRIFGSGFMWRVVMGDDYDEIYKTVIQEGLELLGYMILLYGSIFVFKQAYEQRNNA
ncbi:MAG: hypothetical protein L3J22_04105 [Xanthomonadales bacterium]|nr:hypothetical protein [Xanthomonadales bacterium]